MIVVKSNADYNIALATEDNMPVAYSCPVAIRKYK